MSTVMIVCLLSTFCISVSGLIVGMFTLVEMRKEHAEKYINVYIHGSRDALKLSHNQQGDKQ